MISRTSDEKPAVLSHEQLQALRKFTTPTVANAIETFAIRPRQLGCTDQNIRCFFPQFGAVVGYAGTLTVRSDAPRKADNPVKRADYWRYLTTLPTPRVVVAQDIGELQGAYWGEVNGNIHRALGCMGVLTNGTVRDLSEVESLGFHLFGGGVSVSHYWAHLEDFGEPVNICGMEVETGDLVHADRHGAVVIPAEIASEVAQRAAKVESDERVIINLCQSRSFSIPELDRLFPPEY